MKQDFWGVLNSFLINNQNSNWDAIFKALMIFLLAFWLAICLWVFIDARSRYSKLIVAILITMFVLVFSIPALIIYVILRPEHTREEISLIANATGTSRQSLPIELDESLLEGGNSFTMHFALNFTPGVNGEKPMINFAVENMDGLPVGENNLNQKKLTSEVEVINEESKEVEPLAQEEKIVENEELKEMEQLPVEKSELKKDENINVSQKKDNIFKKLVSLPKKVINKVKGIRIKIKKPEIKVFSNVKTKLAGVKTKIFPLKAVTPTEVILPDQNTQATSEKLAKSKKKKKNRNRRH